MSYRRTKKLGPLQEKILTHFFECTSSPHAVESTSHIARELGVLQESVQRSVNKLIRTRYLIKDKKYTLGEKDLVLTDKGIVAAVANGIKTEQIVTYFTKLRKKYPAAIEQLMDFEKFKTLFRVPDKRDFVLEKFAKYCLQKNTFNAEHLRPFTSNELKMLMTYISIEYNKTFGNIYTVNKFVNKYGLDKEFVIEKLQSERNRIDSILKELSK